MSTRETITKHITDILGDMSPPRPSFITREPFDLEKISFRQFPAVLVVTGNETREDLTMGGNRRGTIDIEITGFVRSDGREGVAMSVDEKRNNLIERIEEALNSDRTREVTGKAVTTLVREIQINNNRIPPLGEFTMIVEVRYNFTKGAV